MTFKLDYDKATNVMFVDVCEAPEGARINVVDVANAIGFKSRVVARLDIENQIVFGLIIEDFPAFKRELMVKYHTARVQAIIEMIVRSLKTGIGLGSPRHELIPC